MWRSVVTYNPNYLFALHNHQREKIIFFYFWTVGHVFRTGEEAEMSSRAVAIWSPKKSKSRSLVLTGILGILMGLGVFLLFPYVVDLYLFRARRRCGLLVAMMSSVVAAWTRFVLIRAMERKSIIPKFNITSFFVFSASCVVVSARCPRRKSE